MSIETLQATRILYARMTNLGNVSLYGSNLEELIFSKASEEYKQSNLLEENMDAAKIRM